MEQEPRTEAATDERDGTVAVAMTDEDVGENETGFSRAVQCYAPWVIHDRSHFEQGLA